MPLRVGRSAVGVLVGVRRRFVPLRLDVEKIVRETDAAFLLRLEEGDEVWVPKSQISDPDDYQQGDEDCTVSVSEWFANKEGLG